MGVREAPGGRGPPGHADAVGGRGDGDRAHLLRVAPEGAALARAGPRRPQRGPGRGGARRGAPRRAARAPGRRRRPSASSRSRRRCGGAPASTRWSRAPASTPGSSARWPGSPVRAPAHRGRGLAWADRRLRRAKRLGLLRRPAGPPARRRPRPRCARPGWPAGVRATFKTVDTCAAEFEAFTPYHYSTYEEEDEVRPSARDRVVILGSGPNRIGQGIEFDYCCVHASHGAARRRVRDGHGQLQPRDGLDRLRHLRPALLRAPHRRGRGQRARGRAGGGRARRRRHRLPRRPDAAQARPRPPPELVLGTSPASIDLAEDRERWNDALSRRCRSRQPPGGTAATAAEALAVAGRIGYPVLLRPSYVLGGRAMEIVYDDDGVRRVDAVHDDRRAGPRGRRDRRATGPGRPLPRGRHRGGRRRRARRRRRDADRRRHGARRGGGRALGRLGLRAAAPDAGRRGAGHAGAPHPGAGRRPRRVRPHQRAVRRQGRAGLRARGQPARQPHRARSWPRRPACRWPWWPPG